MVHKKYTYKDGKRFGPYFYETKRVGDRIITTYLGTENPIKESSLTNGYKFYLALVLSIVFIISIASFFAFYNFTGHASFDIKTDYVFGEPIQGEFTLNLKEGEFIPSDSEVTIAYYDSSLSVPLSSLVALEPSTGDFYAEGSDISGQGLGYGSKGTFNSYPEINFKLKIIREIEDSKEKQKDDKENDKDKNESTELNETEEETEFVPESESSELNESSSVENNAIESEEQGSEEQITSEEETDEQSDSSSLITGSAIREDFEIAGVVSKDKEFTYELKEGDSVEIVSSSVNYDGEKIGDEFIDLRVEDGIVYVSTDYFVSEEGYGENFLGDYVTSLSIDISQFGISATSEAPIYIELVYNDLIIVSASEDITLSGNIPENASETIQTDVLEIDETQVDVNLTQYNAVIGQPVKWVKTVSVDVANPKELFVQIPEGAENIVIDLLNLTEYAELNGLDESEVEVPVLSSSTEEIEEQPEEVIENTEGTVGEEESISGNSSVTEQSSNEAQTQTSEETVEEVELTVGLTGNVISGHVSADISLQREGKISKFFKKVFRVTGNVVEGEEIIGSTVQEISVNLSSEEYGVQVEYTTQAPIAYEEDLNYEKNVLVVGSEQVHYENVLVYTNFADSLGITDASDIKIKWLENGSLINLNNISDTNGDGSYDYVSWIAPQLSNQTFNLILVEKAKHLDSEYNEIANVYSQVVSLDGNWTNEINDTQMIRVTFEQRLTSVNDITLYANVTRGEPIINVYEKNENVTLAIFENITNSVLQTIYLTNLSGEQKTFDLQVLGGSLIFDYIVDPVIPIDGFKGTGDRAVVPLDNETFAVVYVNVTSANILLEVLNTNGTVFTKPVVVATGAINYNTTKVSATAINSTAIFIGFINTTVDSRVLYHKSGQRLAGPFSGDGAVGTAGVSAVSVTALGENGRIAYCYMDQGEGDFDVRTYENNLVASSALEGNINTAVSLVNTARNIDNRLQCAAFNSTGVVGFYYDGGSKDDTTYSTMRINATNGLQEQITDTDIDAAVGNWGQAVVTSVNRNSSVMVWYNSSSILYAIRGSSNQVIKAPTSLGISGPLNARLSVAAVNNNSLRDYFVLAWQNETSNQLVAAAFDDVGNIVTQPFVVESNWGKSDNVTNMIEVVGEEDASGISICPGKFGVIYNNATNYTIAKTYNLAGDSWDGVCAVSGPAPDTNPPIVLLSSPVNYSNTTGNVLTFKADFTDDVNVSNATLYIYNISNDLIGTNFTGLGNSSISTNISYKLNYSGTFYWNFLAFDNAAVPNSAFNSTNWTLIYNSSVVYVNGSITGLNGTILNASFSLFNYASNFSTCNITFNILNGSLCSPPLAAQQWANITMNNQSHRIKNIAMYGMNFTNQVGTLIEIDEDVDVPEFDDTFAINPVFQNFNNAQVTFTAVSDTFMKCDNWNFTSRNCSGSWKIAMTGLIPGNNYTFTMNATDPGYSQINITNATHLGPNYEYLSDVFPNVSLLDDNWSERINHSDYIRIIFERNLTSQNDITLYSRSPILGRNVSVWVYPFNSSSKIVEFPVLNETELYQVILSPMVGERNTFDLKVVDWDNYTDSYLEFDWITDPTFNITEVFSPDIDMSPVDNETFAVIYTDSSCDCVKFTVQNTNGSVRLAPVTVESTVNVNVSRVGIETVNSTSFFLAWTDSDTALDRRAGYTIAGSTYFAAASGDGAIGTSTHDISLAMFGGTDPKVAYCYVDNVEGDADLRIYNASSGALIGAEINLNLAMTPETNNNNILDCAVAGNTNGTLINYDAGTDDDITYHMFNEAPLETIGDSDFDASVSNLAQVSVTAVNNDRFIYAFYDFEEDRITLAGRYINNSNSLLGAVGTWDIHSNVGNNSRVAITTVADRASGGRDNAVVVWYNGTGNYTAVSVFDENTSRKLTSRQISGVDTKLRLLSVLGKSDGQNLSICPGKFVVAYTNASNTTVFGTYNLDGSNWDGFCDVVTPLVNVTSPLNNSGVRYSSQVLNFSVDDPRNNTLYARVYAGTDQNTTNYDMMLYYGNVSDPTNVTYNWSSMPANRSDPGLFLLYRFDDNPMFGEVNSTIVNDFSSSNLDGYIQTPVARGLGYFGESLASATPTSDIHLTDDPLLNSPSTSGNFSIMFWINLTTTNFTSTFPTITVKQVDTANRDYGIYLRNSSKSLYVSFGNGVTQGTIEASNNTFAVKEAEWYHVVVTFDKATNNATIYINGVVNDSEALGLSGGGLIDTAGTLTIGDFRTVDNRLIYLDDLALYNRTFTPEEVLRHYSLGNGTYFWKVNVTNEDGGQNETSVYKFSVDSHKPHNVSLIYPNDADSFLGGTIVSFNWSVEDYVDLNPNCNLTISNIASANFLNATNATMQNRTLDTSVWDVGTHIWNVTCWDDAYNFNTSLSRTITITQEVTDVDPPIVLLKAPINYSNTTGNVLTFKADFTDNINVSNATLYIWNTTDSGAVDKLIGTNFTGLGNSSISANISYALNYSGVFYWNFLAFDNAADSPNNAFNRTNWTIISNAVTGCQVLNRQVVYYQVNNIVPSNDSTNSVPGPCINITVSNLTYDGNGFNIYNATFPNRGIYVGRNLTHDISNVTLQNVNVTVKPNTVLGVGIDFFRVNDSLIKGSISAFSFQPIRLALSNKNKIIDFNISNSSADGINLAPGSAYNNFTNIISNNNSDNGIEDASAGFNQWLNITTDYNKGHGVYTTIGSTIFKSGVSRFNTIYGIFIAGDNNNFTNILATNHSTQSGVVIAGLYNNITNITSNSNSYGLYVDNGMTGNIIESIYLHHNTYGIFALGSNNSFSNGFVNDSLLASFYSEASPDPDMDIQNLTLKRLNLTEANSSIYSIRLYSEVTGSGINATNIIDSYVGNYSFEGRGTTLFFEETNVGKIKFNTTVTGFGANLSRDISVELNNASVRTDLNIGLNKSANVTIFGTPDVVYPILLRDGIPCSSANPAVCVPETPLTDPATFFVNGFSEYSVSNDLPPIVLLKDPANYSITNGNVLTFKADFTDDVNVSNATLYIWNTSNGVADKIIGTNFTGLGNKSISANISYKLNYSGTFYWNFLAFDNTAGNPQSAFNITNWTIRLNALPFNSTSIIMNGSLGANRSDENLSASSFLVDPEGSLNMNVTVIWHNGTLRHYTQTYFNIRNNSLFNSTLYHLNTTKGHNWTVGIIIWDGVQNSSEINSTFLTVRNGLPVVYLGYPQMGNNTYDRSPYFNWSMSDPDGDILSTAINISEIRSTSTCSDSSNDGRASNLRWFSGSRTGVSNLAPELKCFYDDRGFQYNWSARVNDTEEDGNWAVHHNLSLRALLSINLTNASVQFGSIGQFGYNDTDDQIPIPLVVQNDGNSFVNVTIDGTNLWQSVVLPNNYFALRIDNVTYNGENASYRALNTIRTYTNFDPDMANPWIELLNYSDKTDTAEININITVPPEEGAGSRGATLTVTAAFCPDY